MVVNPYTASLRGWSGDLWESPSHGGVEGERGDLRKEPGGPTDEAERDQGQDETPIQSDDEIPAWSAGGRESSEGDG